MRLNLGICNIKENKSTLELIKVQLVNINMGALESPLFGQLLTFSIIWANNSENYRLHLHFYLVLIHLENK